MRTAAKVFTIIAIIANAIAGLWELSSIGSSSIYLLLDILIVSLDATTHVMIGVFAFIELSKSEKKPSVALSVLNLLGGSPIAGILMLYINEKTSSKKNDFICERCKRYDPGVEICPTKTYLGTIDMKLCPSCKEGNTRVNRSSMQCEDCYAMNNSVKEYSVSTPDGTKTKKLCSRCKAKYD